MNLMLACKTSYEVAEAADRTERHDSYSGHVCRYWSRWKLSEIKEYKEFVWREEFPAVVPCKHVTLPTEELE